MEVTTVFIQIAILAGVLSLLVINVTKKKEQKPASEVGYRNDLITTAIQYTINGVIVVDENWCIKFWSKGAERIFGWKESEVQGQSVSLIFYAEADFQRLIREPRDYTRQQEFTGKHRLSDATFANEIPIGITLNEFKSGTVLHYTCIVKNIRERIQMEQQHKTETELLNMGEEIGGYGSFMWTVATSRVVCSDALREMFNTDDFTSDFEEMMRSVWWEDQQMVRDTLFKLLKEQKDYELIYRISQTNGKPIRVLAKGRMFYEDGVLHHVGGVVQKLNDEARVL